MKLLILCLYGIFIGISLAQHPDHRTIDKYLPSNISAFDCSARDASMSALASCSRNWATTKADMSDECRHLLKSFHQDRFSICSTISPAPVTLEKETSKPTYTLMDGSTRVTLTVKRFVTEFRQAPPGVKARYTYSPAVPTTISTMENSRTDILGPANPVFEPGFPHPDCTDPDHCYVEFRWRNALWVAENGICTLCKKTQANGWLPLPYNTFPVDMVNGLCKKWQPPATYGC